MTELTRITLSTGVELDVAITGDPAHPPVILLHGFPESHRTWRYVAPDLARDHYVIAPDQRGFARSSKPEGVGNYTPDKIVADLIALADHLRIGTFTLVGHDWGGAIAWMAALQHADRITKLVIVNAPHPLVFQRTIFDEPEQRKASQYIRHFRDTSIDQGLIGAGLEKFLGSTFAKHITGMIAGDDKAAYLDEWSQPGAMTAMLNWYRASAIVVPDMDETPPRPAYLDAPFPPTKMSVLVIWGMQDKALLPSQLDLAEYVPDLTIDKVEAGHFVPWEKPDAVIAAMRRWGV
jgi:pimeloyl-ACP methyl ester carboxylesterase